MKHLQRANLRYPSLWRGCVGAWAPLCGPSGTTLRDNSETRRHGVLTLMDPEADWVVSGGNYALEFDGINDYVSVNPFPTTVGNYSFTAWINPTITTRRVIAAHSTGANNGWRLQTADVTDNGKLTFTLGSVAEYQFTNLTLTANVWQFVAVTVRGTTATGYLNNSQQVLGIGSLSGTPTLIEIGKYPASTSFNFSGKMDDVRIYNFAISEATMQQLAVRRGIAYETKQHRSRKASVTPGGNRRRRVLIGAG